MNGLFAHNAGVVEVTVNVNGHADPHIVLKSVDPNDRTRKRLNPGTHELLVVHFGDESTLWAVLPKDPTIGIRIPHLNNLDRDNIVKVVDSSGKDYFHD